MIRKIVRVLIVACAFAVLAPIASASACQAIGGSSSYQPGGYLATNHGISCSAGTSGSYQLRTYVQANSGGWHSVTGAVSFNYSPPPTYKIVTVFSSCGYLAAADTQIRAKSVLENLNTHSTDVDFGPPLTVPISCQ